MFSATSTRRSSSTDPSMGQYPSETKPLVRPTYVEAYNTIDVHVALVGSSVHGTRFEVCIEDGIEGTDLKILEQHRNSTVTKMYCLSPNRPIWYIVAEAVTFSNRRVTHCSAPCCADIRVAYCVTRGGRGSAIHLRGPSYLLPGVILHPRSQNEQSSLKR